jgi:hypothetical protein
MREDLRGAVVDAVETVNCESWEDFKAEVHRDYAEEVMGVSPLFRGHARKEWKLASPWDRQLETWVSPREDWSRESKRHHLEKILRDFKDLATGLPGLKSRELDDLDWWAIGRHYGLVTPLLDWTRSPYVAAFFAFTGFIEQASPGMTTRGSGDLKRFVLADMSEPVAVWAFMVGESVGRANDLEVLSPRIDVGHRQRAQRGLFTKYLSLEEYLSSIPLDPKARAPLRKYLIPGRVAPQAITELRMMNITFATLFPDLEGAAWQANFETSAFALMALSFTTHGKRQESDVGRGVAFGSADA